MFFFTALPAIGSSRRHSDALPGNKLSVFSQLSRMLQLSSEIAIGQLRLPSFSRNEDMLGAIAVGLGHFYLRFPETRQYLEVPEITLAQLPRSRRF